MEKNLKVDERLIKAFHLMYDNYPEAAQLAHKSKKVIAINPACQKIGREVGMICAQHGPASAHQGCLATMAITNQKPTWVYKEASKDHNETVIFWLPIDGYPDFYIHFACGSMLDYTKNN
jgi:hypothetical protein